MHCPKCGQEQIAEETRFCSRCGFLLTGIAQVIANGGAIPGFEIAPVRKGTSPRRRGVMQGLFVFLLGFLIVPIVAMITVAVDAEPYAVALAMILFGMGGILRAAYALMFESSDPPVLEGDTAGRGTLSASTHDALPPASSIPAAAYAPPRSGMWRDTNELAKEPGSVTDSTTKLIGRNDPDQ